MYCLPNYCIYNQGDRRGFSYFLKAALEDHKETLPDDQKTGRPNRSYIFFLSLK